MRIIDAHCHIHKKEWVKVNNSRDFIIKHFNFIADEQVILSNMEEAGIDQTIIFPLPSIGVDLEKSNHYTVDIANKYPDKLIPFTVIDNKPEYWLKKGAKGFKEHSFGQRIQKDNKGNDIFSQKFKNTYKFMEEKQLPLLLHAGVNKVERLKEDILKDNPKLKVIVAHLGADYLKSNKYMPEINNISDILNELKEYPNIYYDISTIKEKNILIKALEIIGVGRIIFGSDFPYEKPDETLKRFKLLDFLSERDKERVLYKNINIILKEVDVDG